MVGSLVWVDDPEETWIDGEVQEVNGEEVTINCSSGKSVSASFDNSLLHLQHVMETIFLSRLLNFYNLVTEQKRGYSLQS